MTTQFSEQKAMQWLKDSLASESELAPDQQARLWARVSQDVSALAFGSGGVTTSEVATSGIDIGSWRRVIASRLALWSAPALVVGGVLGVAAHANYAPAKTRTVYVERVTPLSTALPVAARTEPQPIEREAAPETQATPQARVERATIPPSGGSRAELALRRERAILDPARVALASGEPARAIELATRHNKEFPNGILSEERETIAINALVRLGSYAQARRRAASFRAAFPTSLMLHAVDAAIAAVPKE